MQGELSQGNIVSGIGGAWTDAPPQSLSGLVDAILGVGRARKALLDQLRSSLESGNDTEALRFARQYCGLTDGRQ
jgi:hypothetical protein